MALCGRLISLHVVQAGALEQIAERQQLGYMILDPSRGRILDRSGRPLAINVESHSVYAAPSRIADPKAFARAVAPALRMRPDEVVARLNAGRHFAWLSRKVRPSVAEAVRSLGLDGQIGLLPEPRREYPNGVLAAHIMGFAGIDNQGLAGAELALDASLRGRPGRAIVGRDAIGRPRFETRTIVRRPVDGADALLTVDQVIQHVAERELARALEATRAAWGTVVVMDPGTGEILAMAVAPAFNPNAVDRSGLPDASNRAISSIYEPGSTFKIILLAAALEAGAVGRQEVFISNGELKVAGGHTIREARGKRYPRQTLTDILVNSSNVGAAMVASRLGRTRYHELILRFGFGEPTGIDLPGEAAGLVPAPADWLGPGLETIGFGQGISVTPLQLLVAGAALANEGVLVRPHVLRAIRDPSGRALEVTVPAQGRRAVSAEVARSLMEMMEESVRRGSGTLARVEGYRVAGKTGTAQKPSPSGGYLPDSYVASFIGLVPAERPRLAILVVLDEPRGQYFGGIVAAPVFQAVASRALWHLRVPPPGALGLSR